MPKTTINKNRVKVTLDSSGAIESTTAKEILGRIDLKKQIKYLSKIRAAQLNGASK